MSPHPLRDRSRELRNNATQQENQLWHQFLSAFSLRFHRQKVIGNYIVDFYCHQAKLVVELDGGQHFSEEGLKLDELRASFLESQGLFVLRFTNWEINHRFFQVCQRIEEVVNQRLFELSEMKE